MKMKLLTPTLILIAFSFSAFGQESVDGFITKSNELGRQGKFAEAVVEIGKAIELQPNNPRLYEQRARFYQMTREYDLLAVDAKKIVEIAPNDPQSYFSATRLLLRCQKCKVALNLINDAVIRFPSTAEIYAERSRVKTCLEDFEGAMEDLKQAMALDPLNENYKHNRANLLRLMDRKQEAMESYDLLIYQLELKLSLGEEPQKPLKFNLSGAYINRARVYAKKNEVEKSFADLDRAVEVNPSFYTYRTRSRAYAWQKMYDKALLDLRKALLLEPDNMSLYLERGNLYSTMGKLGEALKDYEFALNSGKIHPTNFIEKRIEEIKKQIASQTPKKNQK